MASTMTQAQVEAEGRLEVGGLYRLPFAKHSAHAAEYHGPGSGDAQGYWTFTCDCGTNLGLVQEELPKVEAFEGEQGRSIQTVTCVHGPNTSFDHGAGRFAAVCSACPPMVTCAVDGCRAVFYFVAERPSPGHCIEHAADIDRAQNGWSPFNSID